MFRHSLRVRLLLPVLALVVAAVIVVAIVLAMLEASRVKDDALGLDQGPNFRLAEPLCGDAVGHAGSRSKLDALAASR